MANKTKLSEQVMQGQNARAALDALEDAFTALEAKCFDTFRRSAMHDDDGRKMCRVYLRVLEDVKARFAVAINNGEMANKELLRMKEESKLKKVFKRV